MVNPGEPVAMPSGHSRHARRLRKIPDLLALRCKKHATMPASSRGGVAQLGERRVRNAEVGSSILLLSTTQEKGLGS